MVGRAAEPGILKPTIAFAPKGVKVADEGVPIVDHKDLARLKSELLLSLRVASITCATATRPDRVPCEALQPQR
jgi:hypothetical protein